jgi:drug/metabolite transporter (DMT)-like permease
MLAAGLALASSVVWGVSDFVGGMLARRHSVAAVTFLSQACGVSALAVAAVLGGAELDREALAIGLAAGVFGGITIVTFYQAITLGQMSVASPLLSLGAVLSFAVAVAAGERPSALAYAGAPLALVGVVLASAEEHASGGQRRTALAFALAAPLSLGGSLYLIGLGSQRGGGIPTVLGARLSSVALLLALAVAVRPTLRLGASSLAATALIGMSATGAFVLFGYAADRGLISVASVLASLYPIVTVLLAYTFVHERLRPVQVAGAALALLGAALVTTA